MNQFDGMKIALLISDPWEFGTKCGVGPFMGSVSDIEEEKMLIILDNVIDYLDTQYKTAICQIRHEGSSFKDLKRRRNIPVNIVLLPAKLSFLSDITTEIYQRGLIGIGSVEAHNE